MGTKKRELMSDQVRQELENNPIPAYMHYHGQQRPQPAHILISPEQEHPITVSYNANIGSGVSAMVWHGRELEIPIRPEARGKDILKFIEEHAEEFWQVVNGYSCEWDGSNMKGRLSDEAHKVYERLERLAYDIEITDVYTTPTDLWIDDEITADSDPRELAGDIIYWKVNDEGAVLQFDVEELVEYITERQKELFGEDE